MPRKCSVYGCRTGYNPRKGCNEDNGSEKVTVYSFPSDLNECRSWIAALPNANLKADDITNHVGVCSWHWPPDVPMQKRGKGRFYPSVPPSVFSSKIPKSSLPTNSVIPRTTTKALSAARIVEIDEMDEFIKNDKFASLSCEEFHNRFNQQLSSNGKVAFDEDKKEYILLSKERDGPVFNYTLIFTLSFSPDKTKITQVKFEAYSKLKLLKIPYGKNEFIWTWSQLEEVLRVVSSQDEDNDYNNKPNDKMNFIIRQIMLMNTIKQTSRLYDLNDLILAFGWFVKSRALYEQLRSHLHLPSTRTLQRITHLSKSIDDYTMYESFFQSQNERSRNCILIVDEIYIKSAISYSGGEIFGYAQDKPATLAKTLLCIMVKCFFTSKKFLARLVPCNALTSEFQFLQLSEVISLLERCGANVVAIISDNNRVNQSCFKLFPNWSPSMPYFSSSPSSGSPLFLLFDPVHLVKNIRNNWITEKTQTLAFPSTSAGQDTNKLAKWNDLKELFDKETKSVTLSKLTKATIRPSNMEKQKVSLALNVFCESTISALNTSAFSTESWKVTAEFISMVLRLWKLFNCKSPVKHIHKQDPDAIPIDSGEMGEKGRKTLIEWANIASTMTCKENPRKCLFTKDTGFALQWTCAGLASLCNYLLSVDSSLKHDFVCLGFFQQDDIEQHFGHFRRAAGCNYFITVNEVFNTHALDRTKLMLSITNETEWENMLVTNDSHQCSLCQAEIDDAELLALDEMTNKDMNQNITLDERMAIFYIAGYVASKHHDLEAESPQNNSPEIKAYFDAINRKSLKQPSDEFLLLSLLSYYYFIHSKEEFCRKKLVNTLNLFPSLFSINVNVPMRAYQRLANVLLNNFRKKFNQETLESERERKRIKFMSKSN